VAWAATANVAFKNTDVKFDCRFPKTGGGEDIDFCLRTSPGGLICVPKAAAYHPLWNHGRPSFLRFAMWSVGDGALISMYRRYTYRAPPTAAELTWTLLFLQAFVLGSRLCCFSSPTAVQRSLTLPFLLMAMAVVAAEMLMDLARNMLFQERLKRHPCNIWCLRAYASVYATVTKFLSDTGRIAGHLHRGQPHLVCTRFDWFCGLETALVREEQHNGWMRMGVYMMAVLAVTSVWLRW
jgi:hypothetical protein